MSRAFNAVIRAFEAGPSSSSRPTGLFNTLSDVSYEALPEGWLEPGDAEEAWNFGMENLTIGQLVDFFAEHGATPGLIWHNETGGPGAYVVIWDYECAEAFRDRFGVKWLSRDEDQARRDEDNYRAGFGRQP